MKDVQVTLGVQNVQGPVAPNARFVMVQPSAKMPDGSVRELQPYEVVVTHRMHAPDLIGAMLAVVALMVVSKLMERGR